MTNYNSTPEISVVISCYNSEKWLIQTLESISNQTFRNFEIIVIDDGSTDSTYSILNEYQKKDSRLKICKKDNTGLSDSLNIGIKLSEGKWIARIDADDICHSDRLYEQLKFSKLNPDTVLITSYHKEFFDDNKNYIYCRYPKEHTNLVNNLEYRKRFPAHSSSFFLKEAFEKVGGYRCKLSRAEDYDLWLRLSEIGNISCVDKYLVMIRKHDLQISNDNGGTTQIIDALVSLVSHHLRKLKLVDPIDSSDFPIFYDWVKNNYTKSNEMEVSLLRSRLVKLSKHYNYLSAAYTLTSDIKITMRLLRNFIFGSNLGFILSQKWINENSKD